MISLWSLSSFDREHRDQLMRLGARSKPIISLLKALRALRFCTSFRVIRVRLNCETKDVFRTIEANCKAEKNKGGVYRLEPFTFTSSCYGTSQEDPSVRISGKLVCTRIVLCFNVF